MLLWGWAWELGRSVEQVEAAGWAGCLTFPRELVLVDDVLSARPAAELTGLRRERLDPAAAVEVAAFEVLADGPVTLSLVSGGTTTTVLELGAGPHRCSSTAASSRPTDRPAPSPPAPTRTPVRAGW